MIGLESFWSGWWNRLKLKEIVREALGFGSEVEKKLGAENSALVQVKMERALLNCCRPKSFVVLFWWRGKSYVKFKRGNHKMR